MFVKKVLPAQLQARGYTRWTLERTRENGKKMDEERRRGAIKKNRVFYLYRKYLFSPLSIVLLVFQSII